jgi:hypothetical protein
MQTDSNTGKIIAHNVAKGHNKHELVEEILMQTNMMRLVDILVQLKEKM